MFNQWLFTGSTAHANKPVKGTFVGVVYEEAGTFGHIAKGIVQFESAKESIDYKFVHRG